MHRVKQPRTDSGHNTRFNTVTALFAAIGGKQRLVDIDPVGR